LIKYSVSTVGLALALAAVAIAPCRAGQPLQTEDADTLERAACELEGTRQQQRSTGADSSGEFALALGCGVGWDSQVGLGFARATGSDGSRGVELRGKTRIWRAEPEGAALTLAWALGSGRPDGGEWRHEHNEFTLVASLPLGPGIAHLNLGHARDLPSRLISTPWGLAWERLELDWGGWKWAPMAEVFGDDHGSSWWNTGARFTVREDQLWLNLSYGCSWQTDRKCLATLGFKVAF
jgi:hypothetical protein